MAAPSIAISPELRTNVQGKRLLIMFASSGTRAEKSVTSYDERGSMAARSRNGSEPRRFPNGAPPRQRRRPRGISKIIYHADGQKVACAVVDSSKKSKRAATQGVFQTSSGFWRNGAIRNAGR